MNEKTDYGNWVPEKALYMLFGLAAVFLVAAVVFHISVISGYNLIFIGSSDLRSDLCTDACYGCVYVCLS